MTTESGYVASMTPSQRRRYERKAAITPMMRVEIGIAAGWCCAYCRRAGDRWLDPDGKRWNIDHVTAIAHGGTDDRDNLALACVLCNRSKGTLSVAELFQHLALMLNGYAVGAPDNLPASIWRLTSPDLSGERRDSNASLTSV